MMPEASSGSKEHLGVRTGPSPLCYLASVVGGCQVTPTNYRDPGSQPLTPQSPCSGCLLLLDLNPYSLRWFLRSCLSRSRNAGRYLSYLTGQYHLTQLL